MSDLDPALLFDLIARHVPQEMHAHILIVGSLAAAYHHRADLRHDGINTKDADVIIHPAGAVEEAKAIAQRLLRDGWQPTEKCRPSPEPTPVDDLPFVRLYPPGSNAYFIELLAFPEAGQRDFKAVVPFRLADGWYGMPSFRFMGLTDHKRQHAANGIAYAAPAMMALSNLLAHPTLGSHRMSEPIGGRSLLRSAKDLGRVLALARLAPGGRDETEAWVDDWEPALRSRFPTEYATLAARTGSGLRELLNDPGALDEARHAVDVGLLAGRRVTVAELKALGQQLLADAIDVLAQRCVKP